ncbi:hypothetical protein IFO70_03955 [Phormidium tenue FACHB-886]|nr:hypothetical protein [Phormidium tenue FACHB-886]
MTQPHVLELAKQGDPDAIATLMNQSLQPRGMTAFVDRQGDVLEVILEAERVPNRDALTAFVQKGIDNLGIESVRSVRIVGQQTGATFPTWMQELNLAAFPLELAEPPVSPELPAGDLSDPDVQPAEMLDLSPTDDSLLLEESLLELPSDTPLDLDDRSLEESIDSFAADPQQLALEAQLQSLWAEPANDDLLNDLLAPTEPISEAEFQDLFAEDSPELNPEPPTASVEDLLIDNGSTVNQAGSLEDLFAEESPTTDQSAIEDLFTEENLTTDQPAIEDLFAQESPTTAQPAVEDLDLFTEENLTTDQPAIEDLFAQESPAADQPQAIEDLFTEENLTTDQPAIEDLFTEENLTTDQSAIEDLFTEESPAADQPQAIEDLFAEESPATDQPAIEDLFAEESPTTDQPAIEDLFAQESPAADQPQAIEDLFAQESPTTDQPDQPEAIENLFTKELQPSGEATPSETADLFATSLEEPLTPPADLFGHEEETSDPVEPDTFQTFFVEDELAEQEPVPPPVDLTPPDAATAESLQTLEDLFDVAPDTESSEPELSGLFAAEPYPQAELYSSAADDSDSPLEESPTLDDSLFTLDLNEPVVPPTADPDPLSEALGDQTALPTSPSALEELDDESLVASLQDLFGSDAPPDELTSFELAVTDSTPASEPLEEVDLLSLDEYAEAITPTEALTEAVDEPVDDLSDLSTDLTFAQPTAAEPVDDLSDLSTDLTFAQPTVIEPAAADASEQPIPEDWLNELQGLNEAPIEYVFDAAEPEAPPLQTEGDVEPVAPLPEDLFAAPNEQSLDLDAANSAQQELEAQIDNLWAEQSEEPTFELEEEPIDSPIASSDLTFDWETLTSESPLVADSQPSTLDSLEDPLFDLEAAPAEATEATEIEEISELEPIIFSSFASESTDESLAALFGDAPNNDEPILQLEETLEAPPGGELSLEGDLPRIEEIPAESAFDEASLAEAAEQPTLLLPRGWEERLLAENALLPLEEIPAESADLDETFLAEVADDPTLPPLDETDISLTEGTLLPLEEIPAESADLDETFLAEVADDPTLPPLDETGTSLTEDALLPLEEIPAESADLDETFLAEVADDPTLPPPENWEDELLFDLPDESAQPTPEPISEEPIDRPSTPLESLSFDFLAEEPLPPSDYVTADPATASDTTLDDLFAEPLEAPSGSIDSPITNDFPADESFGAGLSQVELAELSPDLLDETPDEPIANLMHDPLQDDLGIDVLEEPATASTESPTADDDFEAELAGLTLDDLDDLPEAEAATAPAVSEAELFSLVDPSVPDAVDATLADLADPTTDDSLAPDLELSSNFFDTPTAPPAQSASVTIDEFYDLPPDLLDQPQESQPEQAAIPELFPAPPIPLSDDRLSEEVTEATFDPLELDADAAFADETPSPADIDFLPEDHPVSSNSLDFQEERFLGSPSLPAEPPIDPPSDLDEVGNLSLGLDPDAFTEEDVRLAHTNSWETDNMPPAYSEDTEANGMSEAAVVAAGLVGAGGLAADRPTFEGGTIGNGRDYSTAGTIEATNTPWLYTAVLLGVSGLIAGLLGYSLWSEVARRPSAPAPPPPASNSPSGALPQEMLQAADEAETSV